MDVKERHELVDMVAQAVMDKIEERERVNALANLVFQRVLALQEEEAKLNVQQHTMPEKENTHDGAE